MTDSDTTGNEIACQLEAALRREVNPHLVAALALVHAQSAPGSGVQNFMSQTRHRATVLAPDFVGGLE